MKVNEIFLSVQGESMSAGFPTIFVRFTGCNLRCSYCDTTYAYYEGTEMTPAEIMSEINKLHYKRVCITGGEPLLQEEINELLDFLRSFSVSIETNGSVDVKKVTGYENLSLVVDMKAPSSGVSDSMLLKNIEALSQSDEVKFVIGNRNDYEWARSIVGSYPCRGVVTFSPVFKKVSYREVVEWILEDRLDVRFQIQLHKIIWDAEKRGV